MPRCTLSWPVAEAEMHATAQVPAPGSIAYNRRMSRLPHLIMTVQSAEEVRAATAIQPCNHLLHRRCAVLGLAMVSQRGPMAT